MIIQQTEDLSDEEAVRQFAFNMPMALCPQPYRRIMSALYKLYARATYIKIILELSAS